MVSLLSLIGLAFISVAEEKLKRIIFFMVSLAVGGLFGDAFIHLLPESFERIGSKLQASVFVLAGIFAFLFWRSFCSGDINTCWNPITLYILWVT